METNRKVWYRYQQVTLYFELVIILFFWDIPNHVLRYNINFMLWLFVEHQIAWFWDGDINGEVPRWYSAILLVNIESQLFPKFLSASISITEFVTANHFNKIRKFSDICSKEQKTCSNIEDVNWPIYKKYEKHDNMNFLSR